MKPPARSEAQKLIGRTIRAFREGKGLTLEQLAPSAGITYQYLSGLENGHENFSIGVLERLSLALSLPVQFIIQSAYREGSAAPAAMVDPRLFRAKVPLPGRLTPDALLRAMNHTQSVMYQLNESARTAVGRPLQDLIQGNNFSGLVSNLFSDAMDRCTPFKHNHHQRYPDLICAETDTGLEVKATTQIGKGGESHNGHGGWHTVICFERTGSGIQFTHVMFAVLRGHQERDPDWKYVGSRVNKDTGSRRTETYNTSAVGTTKLRDGSVFLDPGKIDFSRWRQSRKGEPPSYSIFAQPQAKPTGKVSRPTQHKSKT